MGTIVAMVRNLQTAHDYYKESYEDCRGVIKQLIDGVKPGEVEYIHPQDMGDMLNDIPLTEMVTMPNVSSGMKGIWIRADGRKYKQSPSMPQKSKILK